MLFYVSWKPRPYAGAGEKALEVFTRWQPPKGLDIKGMWGRADGGGLCVCEASSSEVVFEACAPWAGALLEYDIVPIVPIEKAVELTAKGTAFRNG
jgi:hypothetical protein